MRVDDRPDPAVAKFKIFGKPKSLRIALKDDVPPPDLLGSRCAIAQGRLVFHIFGAMAEFDFLHLPGLANTLAPGFLRENNEL